MPLEPISNSSNSYNIKAWTCSNSRWSTLRIWPRSRKCSCCSNTRWDNLTALINSKNWTDRSSSNSSNNMTRTNLCSSKWINNSRSLAKTNSRWHKHLFRANSRRWSPPLTTSIWTLHKWISNNNSKRTCSRRRRRWLKRKINKTQALSINRARSIRPWWSKTVKIRRSLSINLQTYKLRVPTNDIRKCNLTRHLWSIFRIILKITWYRQTWLWMDPSRQFRKWKHLQMLCSKVKH